MGEQLSALVEEPPLASCGPVATMDHIGLATHDSARREHRADKTDLHFERCILVARPQRCVDDVSHGSIENRRCPAALDRTERIGEARRRLAGEDDATLLSLNEVNIHRVGIGRTGMTALYHATQEGKTVLRQQFVTRRHKSIAELHYMGGKPLARHSQSRLFILQIPLTTHYVT
jgi:hypothetical protein